jgi:hypothetical protein
VHGDTEQRGYLVLSGVGLVDDVQKMLDGRYQNYGWLMSADAIEFLGTANREYITVRGITTTENTTYQERPLLTLYGTLNSQPKPITIRSKVAVTPSRGKFW